MWGNKNYWYYLVIHEGFKTLDNFMLVLFVDLLLPEDKTTVTMRINGPMQKKITTEYKLTVSWTATSPKRPEVVQGPHAQSSAPSWNKKNNKSIPQQLETDSWQELFHTHQPPCKGFRHKNKLDFKLCVEKKGSSYKCCSACRRKKKAPLNQFRQGETTNAEAHSKNEGV